MYKISEKQYHLSGKKIDTPSLNKNSHHLNESAVFSSKKAVRGNYESIVSEMALFIGQSAEWIERNKGIIGHIKGFIHSGDRSSSLSMTGGDVVIEHLKGESSDTAEIIITAIVLLVDESMFISKLQYLFNEIGKASL